MPIDIDIQIGCSGAAVGGNQPAQDKRRPYHEERTP